MFDGKRFLPETGTPIRKIACMSRLLALDEPVPLTLASLSAKSLTLERCVGCAIHGHDGTGMRVDIASGISSSNFCMSQAAVGQRSAQRPQWTQRSSSLTITRPVCGSAAET